MRLVGKDAVANGAFERTFVNFKASARLLRAEVEAPEKRLLLPARGTLTTFESAEIAPSFVFVLTVIKIGGSSAKSARRIKMWSAVGEGT